MVILDPYAFNAVGVFGLAFQIIFKSCSTYCDSLEILIRLKHKICSRCLTRLGLTYIVACLDLAGDFCPNLEITKINII